MVAADLVEITEGGNTTKSVTGAKILGYIGADNLAAVASAATARGNIEAQKALTAGTGITLASDGTISAGQIALTTVQIAGNETAHLALTTEEGDVVVRSDENKSYIRNSGSAGNMNDFTLLATPTMYTHPNHSGEVTSTADGATVIANNVVDEANLKVSNAPTNGYVLTAQSGNTGGITWAEAAAGGYAASSSAPSDPDDGDHWFDTATGTIYFRVGSNWLDVSTVSPSSEDTLADVLAVGNTTAGAGKIEFRDAALFINSSTDGQLDIAADVELQIVAPTVDINGAVDVSGEIIAASLDISGDADIDGTLEADAITVNGTALATVIAGTTVTNATNATNSVHVSVADNESTNEENLITFIEGASATGNVGLESDGNLSYNPSTGTVTATVFKGNVDAVDIDVDGTLEADAITIGGTAIASVLSPVAGSSSIVTTGALNSGSITSGFGTIDNGASAITTTGVGSFGSLDISGDVDVDGTLEADAITLNGTALGSLYSPIAGGSGIVTTGAINSGSITSGFGTINNGASAITTTGALGAGAATFGGNVTHGSAAYVTQTDYGTSANSRIITGGTNTATGYLAVAQWNGSAYVNTVSFSGSDSATTFAGDALIGGSVSTGETGTLSLNGTSGSSRYANIKKNYDGTFGMYINASLNASEVVFEIWGSTDTKYLGFDTSANATFAGDVSVPATDKIYLDGGSNSYITEGAADNVWIYGGGSRKARFGSAGIFLENADVTISQDATFVGTVTANNTITTIAPDTDHTSLQQKASSTTGAVRQLFENSDNSKNFEISGFFSSGSEQLAVQSKTNTIARFFHGGGTTFEGNINAVAGGINLGATGSANLLNDYEVGTWTPTVSYVSGSPSTGYSARLGNYVKVGDMVTANLYIVTNAHTAGTGHLQITGFPFRSRPDNTYHAGTLGYLQGIAGGATTNTIIPYLPGNGTIMYILSTNNSAVASVAFTSATHIILNITYQTA